MKRFFINSDNYHKVVIISFCILFLLPLKILIIWLLFIAVTLVLFKKNKVLVKDSLANSIDIIISPVTGIVKNIRNDRGQVRYLIQTSCLNNYGLYFPFSSIIESFDTKVGAKTKRIGRSNKLSSDADSVQIYFVNRTGSKVGINIYRTFFSGKPHIWPKIGDKGRVSANFGFLPFGGLVEVTVEENSNQLVNIGEKVLAGSTPLAGYKGNDYE